MGEVNENKGASFSSEKKGVDFIVFLTGLVAEGLVALGAMEHPATKKMEKDLDHASMVIDTMELLKTKTSGNLTKEEEENLEAAMYQLRMVYLAEMGGKSGDSETGEKKS